MNEKLSVSELHKRWEGALAATAIAVRAHPAAYADLKILIRTIIDQPLDITDYFPVTEKLTDLLDSMDPQKTGSIFHLFGERIAPRSIWQVRLLRIECRDLMAHLCAFDEWRKKNRALQVVK